MEEFKQASHIISWIAERIRWFGRRLDDIASVVAPCRFSVLMFLAGFLFLVYAPQGQDILRGIGEASKSRLEFFWFFVSMLFWALSAWYWARHMLRLKDSQEAQLDNTSIKFRRWLRRYFPRALGASAFIVVGIAFWMAAGSYSGSSAGKNVHLHLLILAWICWATAVVFLIVSYVQRRAAYRGYKLLSNTRLRSYHWIKMGMDNYKPEARELMYESNLSGFHALEKGVKIRLAMIFLVAVFFFFLFLVAPRSSQAFGAGTILLLAAANWIAFGSFLVLFGRAMHVPVITPLLVAVLLFSCVNDNHGIRTLKSTPGPTFAQGKTVGEDFPAWLHHGLNTWKSRERQPVFVVAAAGGGIRAAYWTALVLGALTDRNPEFASHVYAISGVSGGSLGAATYAALVKERIEEHKTSTCTGGNKPGQDSFERCANDVLSEDFLAPAVAYMLYPDLTQRFLPFGISAFDRGRALEHSWENAWNDYLPQKNFSNGFHQLWNPDRNAVPALFLNSTWVETGKRVIASNLKIDQATFTDAIDFFQVAKSEVPLSTAVLNSARFTYVSPAGTLHKPDGAIWGHLVDGGYYENSGAATAAEILSAMQHSVTPEQWKNVLPVIFMITNDPNLKGHSYHPAPIDFMNEVRSPIIALLATRDARGAFSRATLQTIVGVDGGLYLHIGLAGSNGPLPLGWVLSDLAKDTMQQHLKELMAHVDDPLDPDQLESMTTTSPIVPGIP